MGVLGLYNYLLQAALAIAQDGQSSLAGLGYTLVTGVNHHITAH
jgi:hypothetical protein